MIIIRNLLKTFVRIRKLSILNEFAKTLFSTRPALSIRIIFGNFSANFKFYDSQGIFGICESSITEYTNIFQMRDNLGVTLDNQSSPSPPEFIPPQRIFAGWLFEVRSSQFSMAKLVARSCFQNIDVFLLLG